MVMDRMGRRSFIGGTATSAVAIGAFGLTACGAGSEWPRLGVRFADGINANTTFVADAGPQRFPFVLIADDGLPLIEDNPSFLEMTVTRDEVQVGTFTVPVRGAGQFTPYYPLVFDPPEPGRYVVSTADVEMTSEIIVETRAEVSLPQIGDTLPAFKTPTFDDPAGVDPVCTRSEPCPFHTISLADAHANQKGTVLLISTPEFCQTDVCGPVLEFLMEAGEDGGLNDLNVIHQEVFADPRNPDPTPFPEVAPLLAELGMEFEPSLFVMNASGVIIDARHYAIDRDELHDALSNR
ncbi:MAG: hypothetical protein HKN94_07930 [Acidimicrobiales bacterium]|nr:hypothetical protein [Acidimicrobiales bacterium]RZV42419.1 MAG: hypothetical protein EX269_14865 [Acidimicrobiales bacterium]